MPFHNTMAVVRMMACLSTASLTGPIRVFLPHWVDIVFLGESIELIEWIVYFTLFMCIAHAIPSKMLTEIVLRGNMTYLSKFRVYNRHISKFRGHIDTNDKVHEKFMKIFLNLNIKNPHYNSFSSFQTLLYFNM